MKDKKQSFNNHSGLVALLCLMPLIYCLLLYTESSKGKVWDQSQGIDVSFPTYPWLHQGS